MKKINIKFIAAILAMVMIISISCMFLVGCNQAIFDTNFTFDYAYIYDTGGKIVKQGRVEKWTDYEDGEQLQIWFEDGSVWLTNSTRCDLVNN